MEHLLDDHKDHLNEFENNQNCTMRRSISFVTEKKSVETDFPSDSKGNALIHCTIFKYSSVDWVGFLEMFHGRVSLHFVFLLLLNFVSGSRLELTYISFIIYILEPLYGLRYLRLDQVKFVEDNL